MFLLLAVTTCVMFFNSCEFFGGGDGNNDKGGNSQSTDTVSSEPNLNVQEIEEGMELLSDRSEVIKPNPQNSPGNPAFINVNFTDEEYETSPAYVATVSIEDPEADFLDDIHVNLKSYNMHNDTDQLYLEVMPVKTDPTYGNELYTYNFWLESGQDKFGTEVELTLPIHNGKDALRNVLWHNWETGIWEELFFTIADDGKTCTAYIDHFSEVATEEANAKEAVEKAKNSINTYGSVFIEGVSGVGGDKDYHATDGVGLVNTADFFKIVQMQTETAKGVFEVLNKGGGIPANSDMIEGLDSFGFASDVVSTAIVLGQAVKLVSGGLAIDIIGLGISQAGYLLLNMRVMDMKLRGVEPKKIEEENRWGQTSLIIGFAGNIASFAGWAGLSTICSWVCVGIFAGTIVYSISENYVSKAQPFGKPATIEEGAYHQYMRTPTTDVLKKLDIQSDVPLTGTGKGWADAFNAIFKDGNILDSKEKSDKVVALYNTYVNYFWTDMSRQDQENYWRAYVDFAGKEKWNGERYNFPSRIDEQNRLLSIFDKTKMIRKIGDYGDSYHPMSDSDFESMRCEIKFDSNYIIASQKDYKHRAMEALAQNTNRIIYDLIKKEYHKTVIETRLHLYNEVLPTLNAMLYFYAEDQSLGPNEFINKSRYYGYNPITQETDPKKMCKMEFKCDRNKPLFNSANTPAPWYALYLQPEADSKRLGRCNIYHYLQYGAPQYVTITPKDNTLAELTGDVVLNAGTPYRIRTSYGEEEYGFRVPVRFNDKNKQYDPLDIKMRISEEVDIDYRPWKILDEYGDKAEEHLLPKDIHVVVKKDGTLTIDIPALTDLKCKETSYNRNSLSIRGQVVSMKDYFDKDGVSYTLYQGSLPGDYSVSCKAAYPGMEDHTTTITTTLKNTEKYQRNGNSPMFSRFLLLYCPKDGHYEMGITLVGDYESVKDLNNGRTKPKSEKESPFGYYFQLTTGLDGDLEGLIGNLNITEEDMVWK